MVPCTRMRHVCILCSSAWSRNEHPSCRCCYAAQFKGCRSARCRCCSPLRDWRWPRPGQSPTTRQQTAAAVLPQPAWLEPRMIASSSPRLCEKCEVFCCSARCDRRPLDDACTLRAQAAPLGTLKPRHTCLGGQRARCNQPGCTQRAAETACCEAVRAAGRSLVGNFCTDCCFPWQPFAA